MSSVLYSFYYSPLSDVVNRLAPDDQVVIVQGLSTKIFQKTVFPQETHYRKREESVYEEFVAEYVVTGTIRSTVFRAGDRFWVWEEPSFSYEDVRRCHETGFSRSPDILEREPEFPLEQDRFIAFVSPCTLKSSPEFPILYSLWAKEGPGAETKIRELVKIKEKAWAKRWWRFWKSDG